MVGIDQARKLGVDSNGNWWGGDDDGSGQPPQSTTDYGITKKEQGKILPTCLNLEIVSDTRIAIHEVQSTHGLPGLGPNSSSHPVPTPVMPALPFPSQTPGTVPMPSALPMPSIIPKVEDTSFQTSFPGFSQLVQPKVEPTSQPPAFPGFAGMPPLPFPGYPPQPMYNQAPSVAAPFPGFPQMPYMSAPTFSSVPQFGQPPLSEDKKFDPRSRWNVTAEIIPPDHVRAKQSKQM